METVEPHPRCLNPYRTELNGVVLTYRSGIARRSIGALVALAVLGVVSSAQAAVTVTSFAPAGALASASVTITGTGFTAGTNTVTFNGVAAAAPTSVTATSMVAVVPAAATSGPIKVVNTLNGTGSSASDFFVYPAGFTSATVDAPAHLTLGTPATLSIATGHMTVQTFTTTSAAQRVFLKWTGSTISNWSLILRDPTGNGLVAASSGTGTDWIDTIALGAVGTYALQITPSNPFSGSLSLTVSSPPADLSGAMTLGTAKASTISTAGQNALYTFTGTYGHRAFIDFTGSTIVGGTVSLLDPSGVTINSTPLLKGEVVLDTTLLYGTPTGGTGTFQVLIDPAGSNTGVVNATVYDVPADLTPAAPLSLPATVSTTITTPGQNATIPFPIIAGHQVSISISNTGLMVGALTIFKADGATPLTTATTIRTATGLIDSTAIPMGSTGPFFLRWDPVGASTGIASFTFNDFSDVASSLTLGATAPASTAVTNVSTTIPGQNIYLTVPGAINDRLSIKITGLSGIAGGKIQLLDGANAVVGQAVLSATGFLGALKVTTAGPYRFLLDPSGQSIGTVSYQVFRVSADLVVAVSPATGPGGLAATTALEPGQIATFTMTPSATGTIAFYIDGAPVTKGGTATLRDASEAVIGTPFTLLATGTWAEGFAVTAGTPYHLVVDPGGANVGAVSLRAYLSVASASGGVIALGGSAMSATTTQRGQNATFTFTGTAGHGVFISMAPSTGVVGGLLKLYDVTGTTLIASAKIGSAGAFIDATTLPGTSGSATVYTVVVDPIGIQTGTVVVSAYDVVGAVPVPLGTAGVGVMVSITSIGQVGLLTMSGIPAGQKIALKLSNPAFSGKLTITDANNAAVVNARAFGVAGLFVDTTVFANGGTYTVKIDPTATGLGTATLQAWAVAAPFATTIVVGGASVSVSASPGQNGTVSFDASSLQQTVHLQFSGVTMGLTAGSGVKITIATPSGTQLIVPHSIGTAGGSMTVVLPALGTYVMTVDPQSDATGNLVVRAY